jgi:hypothetical protein
MKAPLASSLLNFANRIPTSHRESVGFVPTDGDVDVRATTSDGVFRFIGGALLDADSTFAWHDESNPLWEPLLDPNTTSGEPLA